MSRSRNLVIKISVISVFLVVAMVIVGIMVNTMSRYDDDIYQPVSHGQTLDELIEKVKYSVSEPIKAPINLTDASLYDELPDIGKYPLAVEGNGQVDIEIFSSGEKAGEGSDSWLIDCANDFNSQKLTLSTGETVSMSVRSVPSGLAADYIVSQKYLPDLYTPSNTLFADYAMVNGGRLELCNERLAGNTAGILVKYGSGYANIGSVISDVIAGNLNIGYTNPQTSAAGLNLLMSILKRNGDVSDEASIDMFTRFNKNIPYIAYTTQQMAASASNGSLDGMVSEYQAYANNDSLTKLYTFIPFGIRHDNPLYIVDRVSKTDAELEAIGMINSYLISDEAQEIATKYGFNENDSYSDEYDASGAEVTQALKIYKAEKDAGKDIIAVFVADRSSSMMGSPINELKQSLSNGMQYINENNYVGLVSYSDDVTIDVPIARFDMTQKAYFQGGVNRLSANGTTYSYEAIVVAMKMVEEAKAEHPDARCMIFLLSDGDANGNMRISTIQYAVQESKIPIYTIGYNSGANMNELRTLSSINEAASISADSDDIVYQIKSLFNAQL